MDEPYQDKSVICSNSRVAMGGDGNTPIAQRRDSVGQLAWKVSSRRGGRTCRRVLS